MNQLSRRNFLRITAGVGGLSLLAACAPTTSQPAETSGSAATTEQAEITFWWWDAAGQIWADGYAEVNPDVKVAFVNTPFADAHDKLLTSFAAGSGAPDVASIELGASVALRPKVAWLT
jgi:multiple sugar transport system substrate-binding protein